MKKGLCAPADTRAIWNAAVGAQRLFHEQLPLPCRIILTTFMGNWVPTYPLTFPSGFKCGWYETNKVFVDRVYTYLKPTKKTKLNLKLFKSTIPSSPFWAWGGELVKVFWLNPQLHVGTVFKLYQVFQCHIQLFTISKDEESTAFLNDPFRCLITFVDFPSPLISNRSVLACGCFLWQWKKHCGPQRRLHLLYTCPLVG